MQLAVAVVVVVEIDHLHDLDRQTAVRLAGIVRLKHAVVVAAHIAVRQMDVHAAVLGDLLVDQPAADVDLTAAVERRAVVDVEVRAAVSDGDDAAVPVVVLRAHAPEVCAQYRAVGALGDGEHAQAEARAVQHRAVALHRGLEDGAGEELHFLRMPRLVVHDAAHGVVEEIFALLLRQKVAELVRQVVKKLLLGHSGQGDDAGVDLARRHDQRGVCQRDAAALRRVVQKVRHRVHREDAPAGHHRVGQLQLCGPFQLAAHKIGHFYAVFTDIKANDLVHAHSPFSGVL